MPNSLDSFRDVFPWPYSWSRDIAGHAISQLSAVSFVYEDLDYWTYENHWSWPFFPVKTPWDHCVDIYWRDDGEERLQLPPDVGHVVSALLVGQVGDQIRILIWWGQMWRFGHGWEDYAGPQGDFVDHIHVEFKEGD